MPRRQLRFQLLSRGPPTTAASRVTTAATAAGSNHYSTCLPACHCQQGSLFSLAFLNCQRLAAVTNHWKGLRILETKPVCFAVCLLDMQTQSA
jgi:hypothetical protein